MTGFFASAMLTEFQLACRYVLELSRPGAAPDALDRAAVEMASFVERALNEGGVPDQAVRSGADRLHAILTEAPVRV